MNYKNKITKERERKKCEKGWRLGGGAGGGGGVQVSDRVGCLCGLDGREINNIKIAVVEGPE